LKTSEYRHKLLDDDFSYAYFKEENLIHIIKYLPAGRIPGGGRIEDNIGN